MLEWIVHIIILFKHNLKKNDLQMT